MAVSVWDACTSVPGGQSKRIDDQILAQWSHRNKEWRPTS